MRLDRVFRFALCISVALLFVSVASVAGGAVSQAASRSGQSVCVGHHPYNTIWYTAGCTGHDEPELDPLSSHAGSAKNLTWTVVLPTDGTTAVDSVGPTFWIGGAVTDPNSLFGQAFLELQFYPNSTVQGCPANGGFNVNYTPGVYSACSPVWEVNNNNGTHEGAAFNAMLTDGGTGGPLLMHAGDTITDHQYVTPAQDGMHITVTDLTTGHSGTIVLNSSAGPLLPAYDTQQLGNFLQWGIVDDAPNALVWEIGHTSPYTNPAARFCLPGSSTKPACYSYNVPTWLGFHPLVVKSVTFGDGSSAKNWSVVSDFGGKAEVNQDCGAANYGTPFCWYPWYAFNGALNGFTYGGDYSGTSNDFGQADQFQQTANCNGPFGANTLYCSTVVK
jgi:hypothetical protein